MDNSKKTFKINSELLTGGLVGNAHNKLFKRDSQRVALSLCVVFSV
ncbi:hypothetical protein MS6_A0277 [Vibrio cholerae MS6]|nr:hypothetical protein MS6_A0277 [Vibrio cholerae MS6]